jgi:transcriptional regulator with XRE-family HTH domain
VPTRSEAIRRLIEVALAVDAQKQFQGHLPSSTEIRNQSDVSIWNSEQKRNEARIFLPVQCRMARAALGLGVRDLAAAAKVSVDTVVRFERGDELKERTIEALRRALEAAGVEFTNADQPGVLLTKAAAARAAKPASSLKPTRAPKAVRVKP